MNQVKTFLKGLNRYQQRHKFIAFVIAVVKKYGDDSAGQKAALLTYYGFLSLFPLLLIVTTLTDVLVANSPHLRVEVIKGLTNYFPLLGNQLSTHVHRLHAGGLALFIGVLFTFYGARGVAGSFRNSVQDMWLIPKSKRDGFPEAQLKSLALILLGGVGFILASILAGLASAAGHGIDFRILSIAVNLFILFWLFRVLIAFSLPKHIPFKDTRVGSAVAAVGLVILQALGGYILAHQLKRLDALYSYFAVALGLIFWLYLQAQVMFYSIEIAVVKSKKLWPRSLDGANTTIADEKLASQVK